MEESIERCFETVQGFHCFLWGNSPECHPLLVDIGLHHIAGCPHRHHYAHVGAEAVSTALTLGIQFYRVVREFGELKFPGVIDIVEHRYRFDEPACDATVGAAVVVFYTTGAGCNGCDDKDCGEYLFHDVTYRQGERNITRKMDVIFFPIGGIGNKRKNCMEGKDKIIVIPDIHGREFWKQAIKGHENDSIVFLGDYVDPYPYEGLEPSRGLETLAQVIEFKKQHPDNVTLLLGNHDLGYLSRIVCECRMDYENEAAIRRLLFTNLDLFDLVHVVKGDNRRFLFSHAGVTLGWIEQRSEHLQGVTENPEILNEMLHDRSRLARLITLLCDVSYLRGGGMDWGSPVWADAGELSIRQDNIPGFIQIFGHTQGNRPVSMADGTALCLDCRRAFVLDTASARIDVEKGWTPSVSWMKEQIPLHYDEILCSMRISDRMMSCPLPDGTRRFTDNALQESVLGTVWGYLLSDCQAVVKEDKPLTRKQMATALCKAGIPFEFIGTRLMIHMDNHDYSFCSSEDTDAYGGPYDDNSFNSGGMAVTLPSEVFVDFLRSFDSLVPENMAFIKSHEQEIRNNNKAEDILLSSVTAVLRPYLENKPEQYEVSLASCNEGNTPGRVELTIDTMPEYYPLLVMTLDADKFIEDPQKWLELGYRIMENPELAKGKDFVKYTEDCL